ncbi:hypothetical protein BY458DRAFT_431586 [Sporodiniella umbellata]|nr:hypothetical protein BY458DRAFT_431586 [Sporodiniella umbellata]
MRLLAVFFRTENAKSPLVSSEFIFFPTWLLHLFRYTQHESTPGRTDVRFLEDANLAKEDHIYRLNHVLNSLFRFNLRDFDTTRLNNVIQLANFMFDHAGLASPGVLPRPVFPSDRLQFPALPRQPEIYPSLILLLHSARPAKSKPMCLNCNTKFASRRRLCVACYRYQLKHNEARPLRLIVANRPGPRMLHEDALAFKELKRSMATHKYCANCGVQETHQWYRNLCGHGHWCETCKSYYLRHNRIRPAELFIKAAKRKVDVRSLVSWSDWSWDPSHPIHSPSNSSLSSSSPYSQPITPPSEYATTTDSIYRRRSSAFYFCN